MHTGESGDVPQYMSYLGVAQLAERVPWEHEAVGSNPATQTMFHNGGFYLGKLTQQAKLWRLASASPSF